MQYLLTIFEKVYNKNINVDHTELLIKFYK